MCPIRHIMVTLTIKKAIFDPATLKIIREFPANVKKEIGDAIRGLQNSKILEMPLSKAMPGIAPGVHEIRVRSEDGSYRAFYYLKIKYNVLIFHAFKKKTQKTPEKEIRTAKIRLRENLK